MTKAAKKPHPFMAAHNYITHIRAPPPPPRGRKVNMNQFVQIFPICFYWNILLEYLGKHK